MLTKIPLLRRLDPFILGILITVGIASLVPADGTALTAFTWATKVAVGILFFLYAPDSPRRRRCTVCVTGVCTSPSSRRRS